MKKDIRLTLRVSGVMLSFIKGKLKIESDYDAVDSILRMYYDYYNPKDDSFVEGVPENGVLKVFKASVNPEKKVVGQIEELKDGIISRVDSKGKTVYGRLDDKGLFKRI